MDGQSGASSGAGSAAGSSSTPGARQPKRNWDGVLVPDAPWYDKSLFSIGEGDVLLKHAALGAGGIAAIIAGVAAVCTFISWRKRKRLAQAASRVTAVMRRVSIQARRSVRRSLGRAEGEASEEEEQDSADVDALAGAPR